MEMIRQITQVVHLNPPDISQSKIIGIKSQIRPYRKGGLMLDIESFQDQTIVHNYGHGGGGATLSYGSSYLQILKFQKTLNLENKQFDKSIEKVAVLGSGWIGLMTASILLSRGYKVSLYSDEFPIISNLDSTENPPTASQVSGAYFCATYYGQNDLDFHNRATNLSFYYFKTLIEKNHPNIIFNDCYETFDDQGKLDDFYQLTEETKVDAQRVKIDFGNGKLIPAMYWQTIVIYSDLFLKDLLESLKQNYKGAFVVHKTQFESQTELTALPEQFIFNCLGLGSAKVFNDADLLPIKGQHIYFSPSPGADYIFNSNHKIVQGYIFHFFCRPDRIVYGGSQKYGDFNPKPDDDVHKQMLQNLEIFYKLYVNIDPKL